MTNRHKIRDLDTDLEIKVEPQSSASKMSGPESDLSEMFGPQSGNKFKTVITKTRNIFQGGSGCKISDWNDVHDFDDNTPISSNASDDERVTENLEDLEDCVYLEEQIAFGGQAYISKAYDRRFHRTVAIKSLHHDLKDDEHYRKSFIAETRVTAQLEHPSIVPVYNIYGDEENGLHLAMKLIHGRTLKEYLERTCTRYKLLSKSELTRYEHALLRKRLEIFQRVCDAISYAHHRQVIHRDLKPENIMIGSFNETYVMDWGIAEFNGSIKSKPDRPYGTAGTLQYMAPEVANKEQYDCRSDIYLLGLILFEIVFLKQAYSLPVNREDALHNTKFCLIESFEHEFHCKVDKDLKYIIAKALNPNPALRYQNVKDLSTDLRNYESGDEITSHPDKFFGKLRRQLHSHYQMLIFTCLILVILVVVGGLAALARDIRVHQQAKNRDDALGEIYSNGILSGSQFDSYFRNYEFLVKSCANTTELLLNDKRPPAEQNYELYTFYEGTKTRSVPPDFNFASTYGRNVSWDHMLYKLPDSEDAKPDAETLRRMQQLYPLKNVLSKAIFGSLKSIVPNATPAELKKIATSEIRPPLSVAYVGFDDGMTVGYPYELDYSDDFDPRTRGWYTQSAANPSRPFWGVYIDSGYAKSIVLVCSQAITGSDGKTVAVASADISLIYLLRTLEETGNVGTYVKNKLLVDAEGNIIADTAHDLNVIKVDGKLEFRKMDSPELLKSMRERKNGWFFVKEGKTDYLYVFLEVETLHWLYIEKIDFGEFTKRQ